MIKAYFLLLLAICFVTTVTAQDNKTDSLVRLLNRSGDDTTKVNLLRETGISIIYENPLKATPYFFKGLLLAKKLQFTPGLERCYASVYLAYSFNAKYDSALLYIDTAIHYALIVGDADRLALDYLNRADAYTNLQNFPAALKNCDTAIKYAERSGNKDRLARIYSIMSDVYGYQNKIPAAIASLDKSEALFEEIKAERMLGITHFGRAMLLQQTNELDKAVIFCNKAIHIADSVKDIQNLPSYTSLLSQLYAMQKKYPEAIAVANQSLHYAVQTGNRKQEGLVHDIFFNIYLEQKNYAKAIEEGLKAYTIMKEEKDLMREQSTATNLAEGYYQAGNATEAYKYLKISRDLNDSMIKQRFNDETARLQTTFEVAQKNKEIELLNKDKELQRQKFQQQRLMMIGAAALALLAVFGIWLLMNRNKLKQRMKELELRNQIAADLHDEVGSSLSSIHMLSQMATQQGNEMAHKDILARMSSNAKETMDKMGDIVWMIKPGETEAGSLKQRMERFAYEICSSKNIHLSMQLEELEKIKLNMEQRKNIYLIFKEALNNAVKYSGTEKLEIYTVVQNNEITLQVKDFGKGFDSRVIKKGNGLDNMQNRAKELNGKLSAESNINTGTTIKLLVPVL